MQITTFGCGDVEQNPGPTSLAVVTANITSLAANLEAVLALPAPILALQETRLGAAAQQGFTSTLRARGWQALWGKPQPLRSGERKASA